VRVRLPPSAPGRVNQSGCWASLLTTARFTAVAFESPALLSWMVNRTGAPASFGTRMWGNAQRIVSAAILGTRTCRVAGAASKADGRTGGGGRDLLVPRRTPGRCAAGAATPFLGSRPMKARGGREAAGLDTSVFRWLVAHQVRALVRYARGSGFKSRRANQSRPVVAGHSAVAEWF
jgi:hypothetical protein